MPQFYWSRALARIVGVGLIVTAGWATFSWLQESRLLDGFVAIVVVAVGAVINDLVAGRRERDPASRFAPLREVLESRPAFARFFGEGAIVGSFVRGIGVGIVFALVSWAMASVLEPALGVFWANTLTFYGLLTALNFWRGTREVVRPDRSPFLENLQAAVIHAIPALGKRDLNSKGAVFVRSAGQSLLSLVARTVLISFSTVFASIYMLVAALAISVIVISVGPEWLNKTKPAQQQPTT